MRIYDLTFADNKRCRCIAMDASETEEQDINSIRQGFHPGYDLASTGSFRLSLMFCHGSVTARFGGCINLSCPGCRLANWISDGREDPFGARRMRCDRRCR